MKQQRPLMTPAAARLAHHEFDFIVCGGAFSGSVVAARCPGQWPLRLGSERDWGFVGPRVPEACAAKMGRDSRSAVDSDLRG
jgi:hypothetical protein